MLIPLGILDYPVSAAGVAAYDLLETEILTGSQATVTFSSLNSTYGADYQHLQVRIVARTDRANTGDVLLTRFNGDSGSNYSYHTVYGNGSTVTSTGAGSDSVLEIFRISGATNTANSFGAVVLDILDPFETTKNTTIRALSGLTGSLNEVHLRSGAWYNTDALTSINFDQFGSNFVTTSRFSIYGLKKASA